MRPRRRPLAPLLGLLVPALAACSAAAPRGAATPAAARPAPAPPSALAPGSVLTRAEPAAPDLLPYDQGAAGLHQRLLKLESVASLLEITAHPDDEDAGTLTALGRGRGVRTALLTLTRGESGANAVGPELFDDLGLVRTGELLAAGRHYGLDDQYVTPAVDFGYSKRLDETLARWDKERVLADVVRTIRINRPIVLLSRFQGAAADGHGNHQAAGLLAREAFRAAGDPARFPEQLSAEGLRPWQPLKLYVSGLGPDEPWSVRVYTDEQSPWLGASYRRLGAAGWSLHRSQTGGRGADGRGAPFESFRRIASLVAAPEHEEGFFDGLDTTLRGQARTLGAQATPELRDALAAVEGAAREARDALRVGEPPAGLVAPLARGLAAARVAVAALATAPEARFMLQIKERQLADALTAALGVELVAVATPPGAKPPASPFDPEPALGPVVPGERFEVTARLTHHAAAAIALGGIGLEGPPGWRLDGAPPLAAALAPYVAAEQRFEVTLPDGAEATRAPLGRASLQEGAHPVREPRWRHLPFAPAPLVAVARLAVWGVPFEVRLPVRTRAERFPEGYRWRDLQVAPALSVALRPERAIVPLGRGRGGVELQVELTGHGEAPLEGEVRLALPEGWSAQPERQPFRVAGGGARLAVAFRVAAPHPDAEPRPVEAIATVGGREYREGFGAAPGSALAPRPIFRDARALVRGVDVQAPAGLKVGYVMGVGDAVPDAIAALGLAVTLLDGRELAEGSLARFDAIVVGTRAYAVREELRQHNARLLDYAQRGGNLIVLYQTPEFDPARQAPLPAVLPPEPEEVSEEDAAIELLAPQHPLLSWPNRLGAADFEGWVEQRGSKFLQRWDAGYTALLSSHDQGQAPQAGGLVSARVGRGRYTYCAYALHRQLPSAVPGAFRLLANLLALGRARS